MLRKLKCVSLTGLGSNPMKSIGARNGSKPGVKIVSMEARNTITTSLLL